MSIAHYHSKGDCYWMSTTPDYTNPKNVTLNFVKSVVYLPFSSKDISMLLKLRLCCYRDKIFWEESL